jgi:hypothetical protein
MKVLTVLDWTNTGFTGSNPAWDMGVRILFLCYPVYVEVLRWTDHPYKESYLWSKLLSVSKLILSHRKLVWLNLRRKRDDDDDDDDDDDGRKEVEEEKRISSSHAACM